MRLTDIKLSSDIEQYIKEHISSDPDVIKNTLELTSHIYKLGVNSYNERNRQDNRERRFVGMIRPL